jgi:hypothetical protein
MKKTVSIFFALVFSLSVFSLSIEMDSVKFLQGDTISFSGNCPSNESLTASALNGKREIFSVDVTCSSLGKYSFQYVSRFIDPPGNWLVSVSSDSGTAKKKFFVGSRKESAYYLVSFLSPSSTEVFRAQSLKLNVRVTDSGVPVNNAEVVFFGLNGERNEMEAKGDGFYFFEYIIPFDAELGEWEILVLAEKDSGETLSGGRNSLDVEVVPAAILIEFIEPNLLSFDMSSKIPVKVNVQYLNGMPLVDPEVKLNVNQRSFSLTQFSENVFFVEFSPSWDERGSVLLEVIASDSADNTGTAEKTIQITGETIFIVRENILIIVVLVVAVISIVLLFFRKIKSAVDKSTLSKKKKILLQKIKELQKSYFSDGAVTAKDYKTALAEFKSELSFIEQKLSQLEKNNK